MQKLSYDELVAIVEPHKKWIGKEFIHIASGDRYVVENITLDEELLVARVVYSRIGKPEVSWDRKFEVFFNRFIPSGESNG